MTEQTNVAIAGGGIGGLTTALALANAGIASNVYERRPAFPEEGAGIQIGPNGTRILEQLGVAPILQPAVATPDVLSVRDGKSAKELTRLPLGDWIAARHGAPYWTAHRRDVHAALRSRAEAEPLISLHTGVEIDSVSRHRDGIIAHGANGEQATASLLVAADGLWSTLRQTFVPNATPLPVGKSAFRSVIPATALPPELTTNAVHIWLASGAHAVHYPVNAGRDIAIVLIAKDSNLDAGWDFAASRDIVQQKITTFAVPLQTLVALAAEWRRWPLYTMRPLPRFTAERTVFVGDAAHPILPFLAQGAVLAMEDAATLAACLAAAGDRIEDGLKSYDLNRSQRIARVASASQRNGRIYQMSGATAVVRNAVMAHTPPHRVMAGFDWLYGWRCPPC